VDFPESPSFEQFMDLKLALEDFLEVRVDLVTQGLLEVCPSRSCPAVAPVVAFAGTAPAPWISSPPPRRLPQAI
jgi:hypothetical protein